MFTCRGEFSHQLFHRPLWSVSWACIELSTAERSRHCPSKSPTRKKSFCAR